MLRKTTLLVIFLAFLSGISAESSSTSSKSNFSDFSLDFSFGKGPETLIALIIPNVALDFFPLDQRYFYTGVSVNYLLASGHVGAHIGLAYEYVFTEVSTAFSFAQNPFSNENETFWNLSVNPKLGLRYSIQETTVSIFIKAGPSVSLVGENNFKTTAPIVDFWNIDGIPINMECGVGWGL